MPDNPIERAAEALNRSTEIGFELSMVQIRTRVRHALSVGLNDPDGDALAKTIYAANPLIINGDVVPWQELSRIGKSGPRGSAKAVKSYVLGSS